jgi:Cu(I)/Ag(I) efflux system membrane fusion protein
MAESRQLPESIEVVAPADGFIVARNISPGQHFEHAMEFYRIADLSRLWLIAEVYQQDAPHVRAGDKARIRLRNEGRQLTARVTDSLPQSEAGGATVKLRLEVENYSFILRPDMLVDIDMPIHLPPAVTVPLDALIDSGAHARVYVEQGQNTFEPREVETGWRFGEQVEIRHGLEPGERVVVAAAFLIDSESRLKTAPSVSLEAPARNRTAIKQEHMATAGIGRGDD